MRYYVTLASAESPAPAPIIVELVELADGTWQAMLDGRPILLDVTTAGTQLSMRLDGRVVDVTFHGIPPDLDIVASGVRAAVRVESDRTRSAHRAGGVATSKDGTVVVRSPMPGRVVRVLAAKGDRVEARQGVLVLEAMKMENEVRTAIAGTVVDVLVGAGTAVEAGARLMTLVTRAAEDP